MYKLLEEMPYSEFLGWFKYLKARPDGWKEDLRTYMVMSASTEIKKRPEEIFGSLRAVFNDDKARKPEIKHGALPGGKMLEMMLKSRDGDGGFDVSSLLGEQ